ncbi:efflux transporter outer membrane subunit [Ottowia sp.]|uniref:efflux transporter outer membrane subunit n=1 Tax=Ottowia sp. TaxID=1898956 RepID=UPI0039E35CE6
MSSCYRMPDKRWRPKTLAIGVGAACLLSACSLAPKTAMDPLPTPTAWKNALAASGWVSADAARAWRAGQWWLLWDDPVLHGLLARVELNNQNLKAAAASVAQAQALLRQQRAGLWPQLGAQASQQRSGGDDSATARSASLSLTASWAPDLWGRIGNAVDAQAASVQASEADLAGARLDAQASLAQAYFALRETDAELALLGEIIAGYERSARITQNRYDVGVVPRTDTFQAEATLRNAQASRVALQGTRAGYEHAIALLVGEAPAGFAVGPAPWTGAVPDVPAEVPSLLLLRRPDVASAERAVSAANQQVGVARSAYFPSLSLSASLGATGNHLGDLLSAPSLLWSLGVALAQTVFDGGARDAQVDQALAARDAAVARYRQSALTAMKEVEDQLNALAALAAQTGHARAAAELAERIEQQMLNRYQAGLTSYTEVVTAQASALSARRSLLQLQVQRQQAALALIQALGGGWQAPWAQAPA